MVFSLSNSGGGPVLQSNGRGARSATAPKQGGSGKPGDTDESAEIAPLTDENQPMDELVRARARQIAARLALRKPQRGLGQRRGAGDLMSVRYRGGSDDIDLDATIEVLAETPFPEDEDIIVRERVRTRRSVVLAVDVSGSSRGERAQTAAAAVGALVGELREDDLAVIAFWSDAAVLLPMGASFQPAAILDALLRVPARGLTNVGFPLQLAAVELAKRPSLEARVLLLSDCVHNAGPDPRGPAARLPRLDVLLDASGEKDLDLGHDLARSGRGRLLVVNGYRDVAPALSRIFTS